jgi:predicted RNase H-like HicB family nuclease
MPKYVVIVESTKTNFSAYSPDVQGCVATGNTVQKAVSEMKAALELHFEGAEILPEPKGLNHYMNDDEYKKESTDYILQVEID